MPHEISSIFQSLILQVSSQALGDSSKTETKHENDTNEKGKETKKIVLVWRFHNTFKQGLSGLNWCSLKEESIVYIRGSVYILNYMATFREFS